MNSSRETMQSDSAAPQWRHRTGTLALILMGLATLGSSWSGYQANLWGGVQTFYLSDSARFSREANGKVIQAAQQRALDAALFVEYARDISDKKTDLAEFFVARMRPELRDAIRAWNQLHPLKNESAPPTPFAMPQYHLPAEREAEDLSSRAHIAHDKAQTASRTSGKYTLLTVFYAAALFLGGLVNTMDDRHPRLVTLILSAVSLCVATITLIGLPIARIG